MVHIVFQRFDGVDLREVSLDHLRNQMVLVGQEPRLFAGTIRENVTFGLEDVSDARVLDACKLANAFDFITAFPNV